MKQCLNSKPESITSHKKVNRSVIGNSLSVLSLLARQFSFDMKNYYSTWYRQWHYSHLVVQNDVCFLTLLETEINWNAMLQKYTVYICLFKFNLGHTLIISITQTTNFKRMAEKFIISRWKCDLNFLFKTFFCIH